MYWLHARGWDAYLSPLSLSGLHTEKQELLFLILLSARRGCPEGLGGVGCNQLPPLCGLGNSFGPQFVSAFKWGEDISPHGSEAPMMWHASACAGLKLGVMNE